VRGSAIPLHFAHAFSQEFPSEKSDAFLLLRIGSPSFRVAHSLRARMIPRAFLFARTHFEKPDDQKITTAKAVIVACQRADR
jgi:hypothetical protein